MNDADWDGFRALLAIADRGSFSKGARELGISQPTASRRIDELERALGTRLLVRRNRGILPTPAGERVLAEVRRMASGASAATRVVAGEPSAGPRRIRISVTEGLGTLWLPHQLAGLSEGMPGLRIDLVIDNLATDLSSRQAELAIRLFRPRQPDLVARKLGAVEFGFFASRVYVAAHGTPRQLRELARHDHVDFLERGTTAPSYVRWLRQLVPEGRFVVGASSLLAMHELARAGRGIVLGTAALLGEDRQLVRLLPRAKPPAMEIWLAVHADVHRDPDVTRVSDRLAALLARFGRA